MWQCAILPAKCCNTLAAIIFIAVQLTLVPCRRIHQQPLKLSRISELMTKSSDRSFRLVRREAPSPEAFAKMENNLDGISGNGYYVDIDIGTPPQTVQLLVDTGSANLAVACEPDSKVDHYFHRDKSSTFEDQETNIYVPYTEGEWNGQLGIDVVKVSSASNLSASAYVSCITKSKDFYVEDADWQGILGLAYTELSRPDSSYTPLWDSLTEQNSDLDDIFSLQLCGNSFVHTKEKPLMDGSLILGGIDPTLNKSDILFTPIYKKWYYEVVLTDIEVGKSSLNLQCKEYNLDKTIVDSGTTSIHLPVKVYNALVDAIQTSLSANNPGGFEEPDISFYNGNTVQCYADMKEPFSLFPVVSFHLFQSENSSFRLDLTPQHYLRAIGPTASLPELESLSANICVKFGFAPSTSGTVLGAVLMEAFYVVFDRSASRIGFGQTTCPLPDPDNPILTHAIKGPFFTNKNLNECAYKKSVAAHHAFLIATYVMAAVCIVIILPIVFVFFSWSQRVSQRNKGYQQSFPE